MLLLPRQVLRSFVFFRDTNDDKNDLISCWSVAICTGLYTKPPSLDLGTRVLFIDGW
jgi:hypothetical protein